MNGHFVGSSYNATIEDKFTKNLEVNGVNVFCEILDTAGQDQYSLRKFLMPLGDVFVLVYDITQDFTFEEIAVIKEEIFSANASCEPSLHSLGNKCDLEEDRQEKEEGEKLCEALERKGPLVFMEASAKTNTNVDELFRKAISEAMAHGTSSDAAGGSGVMGAGAKTTIGNSLTLRKKKKKSMCTLL